MPIDSVGADSIVSYIQSQRKAAQNAGRVKLSQLVNILEKVNNTSIKFSKFQVLEIKADLDGLDVVIRKQGSRKEKEKLGATNNIRMHVSQSTSAKTDEQIKQWSKDYKLIIQGNLAVLTTMRPALERLYRRDTCEAISQMDFALMNAVLADSGVLEVGTNDRGDVVQTHRQIKLELLINKLRTGPETMQIFNEAFAAWEATLASATPQNAS
ncbi:hypothetical protein [Pseudomonas sp. ES3-33]|mgnify:CR=1 FL=1|uniref:hypothetical protein n=1 Tax=Pseudomonas sp. ES3-33 TaxID=1628833 RepID=UPI0005D40453|nr:hypothetical protein [Pseudomonas sp. ES3-33]KJH77440.1 hypothetical protein UB23_08720 [Pseudomonas sp. ES3-33]